MIISMKLDPACPMLGGSPFGISQYFPQTNFWKKYFFVDVEYKNYSFIALVPYKSSLAILVCHIPFKVLLSVNICDCS